MQLAPDPGDRLRVIAAAVGAADAFAKPGIGPPANTAEARNFTTDKRG